MSRRELVRRIDALAQFHVEDVNTPVLSARDAHHLFKVLRAKDDEEVVLTNGRGDYCFARVARAGVIRTSEVGHDDEPTPTCLYLSPLKSDRSEWAVAKAVELGVSRIVPLLAERVVVKTRGEHRDKLLAKWRSVAREAAHQCRRTYDMVIDEPVKVSEVPLDVAVADFEGRGSLNGLRAVAIGPEGGWAPDEWSSGHSRVGLGDMVLRAETAAVVGATLLKMHGPGWSRHEKDTQFGNDEETR